MTKSDLKDTLKEARGYISNEEPIKALSLLMSIDLPDVLSTESDKDYFRTLGAAYAMNHDYAEAMRNLDWVLAKDPRDIYARSFRGNVYADLHEYLKAMEDYKTAIKESNLQGRKDGLTIPYVGLGNVYLELGRRQDALSWYQKALKVAVDISDQRMRKLVMGKISSLNL